MRLNVAQNRRIIRLRRIMRQDKPETHKTVAQRLIGWNIKAQQTPAILFRFPANFGGYNNSCVQSL